MTSPFPRGAKIKCGIGFGESPDVIQLVENKNNLNFVVFIAREIPYYVRIPVMCGKSHDGGEPWQLTNVKNAE